MDLDQAFVYGLRLAKNLENSFIDQIELGFDRSSRIGLDDATSTEKPDANYYFANDRVYTCWLQGNCVNTFTRTIRVCMGIQLLEEHS